MICFFAGNNQLERSNALDLALEKWLDQGIDDPHSKEIFFMDDRSSESNTLERLMNSLQSDSLFCEKKTLVIKNLDALNQSEIEMFLNCLRHSDGDHSGVFVEIQGADSRSKWFKEIKNNYQLNIFENPKPWEMPNWIIGCAQKHNFSVSKEMAQFLNDFIAQDCKIIDSEFEKLRLRFPELKHLDAEIIISQLSPSNQGNIFQLLNAFGLRDKKQFLHLYKKLEEHDPSFSPIQIVNQLFSHTAKLLKIQSLQKNRSSESEICSLIGLNSFLFKQNQYIKQAQKRTNNTLERILIRLADIDQGLKSGEFNNPTDFEIQLLTML
jgi:DNA polymerase III delta subunit